MIMIGDRLDTDILMANSAGVDGCLVFTGVTSSEEEMHRIMSTEPRVHPKFMLRSFGVIPDDLLSTARSLIDISSTAVEPSATSNL
jgi:ribonucleotide monophosphatase NagD (HAD superfamily)